MSIAASEPISNAHVNELYTNINELRASCGAGAYTGWGGLFPVASGSMVQLAHVNALRAAIRDYYSVMALGPPPSSISGNIITGSPIRASGMTNLQNIVENARANLCCSCGGWQNVGCASPSITQCTQADQMYQNRSPSAGCTGTCPDGLGYTRCQTGLGCPAAPWCGLFGCQAGETKCNCAADCGVPCGDGVVNCGETCASCPADAGACCTPDGSCGPTPACGTSAPGTDNCGNSCTANGPSCNGNGVCDAGENCSNAPGDCGACGPVCGNGSCEAGEDCGNCGDCGCPGGYACSGGGCLPSCGHLGNLLGIPVECCSASGCAAGSSVGATFDCSPCCGPGAGPQMCNGWCGDGNCQDYAGEDCSWCGDCGACGTGG